MASGAPVTSSLTAPQKQLPAWDMVFLRLNFSHWPAGKAASQLAKYHLAKKSVRRSYRSGDAMM
jgi:hypothetical protein